MKAIAVFTILSVGFCAVVLGQGMWVPVVVSDYVCGTGAPGCELVNLTDCSSTDFTVTQSQNYILEASLSCTGSGGCKYCRSCAWIEDLDTPGWIGPARNVFAAELPCTGTSGPFALTAGTHYRLYSCLRPASSNSHCDTCNQNGCTAKAAVRYE